MHKEKPSVSFSLEIFVHVASWLAGLALHSSAKPENDKKPKISADAINSTYAFKQVSQLLWELASSST